MPFTTFTGGAATAPGAGPRSFELLEELKGWPGWGPRSTPGWRSEAACRDLPTDLFFPVGHGPRAQAQVRLAKQVCAECRARDECLDYALEANTRYGVFGGLDEDERRQLRRQLSGAFGLHDDSEDEDDEDELGGLEESA